MEYYKEQHEGEQPCYNFQPGRHSLLGDYPIPHECYRKDDDGNYCKGKRWFCYNCNSDHHSLGWETCTGTHYE